MTLRRTERSTGSLAGAVAGHPAFPLTADAGQRKTMVASNVEDSLVYRAGFRSGRRASQRKTVPGSAGERTLALAVLAISGALQPAPSDDLRKLAEQIRPVAGSWPAALRPRREPANDQEVATNRSIAPDVAVPSLLTDGATAAIRTCDLDSAAQRGGTSSPDASAEASPAIAIHALGIFRVTRNGAAVPRTAWQSRKARDLVKILVSRSKPAPRDQLMELLWPGVDPAKSTNRLSVLLSTVRQVLQQAKGGPRPLVTDGTSVWLDASLVSIDVAEFRGYAARALETHRRGSPGAVDLLHKAASLYTGDFLEDDPYAEWAQPTAEELRAHHQAVLRALISHHQVSGDVDAVVCHTLRLFDDDPYDEEAHLNLIKVLVAAGRIGEALRRHEIYRRRVAEIGVEPRPMPTLRSQGRALSVHRPTAS
ncbi:BTAD domain-containing putative transcriptional regulator [Amycolatopsis sp. NPDC059090]|uniref:AfsR/SARP family transcriptional regulator n=1 Tax=unclassified Amycolatopsis TaxID=2618356 RepID=UPI00366EBE52